MAKAPFHWFTLKCLHNSLGWARSWLKPGPRNRVHTPPQVAGTDSPSDQPPPLPPPWALPLQKTVIKLELVIELTYFSVGYELSNCYGERKCMAHSLPE